MREALEGETLFGFRPPNIIMHDKIEAHEIAAGSRGPDRHITIKLFGSVQGVGLRYAILHKAQDLKIKGFVRNEPDSSVYIEVEGPKDALEELVNWCRSSPAWSQVDKFEVIEGVVTELSPFTVQ